MRSLVLLALLWFPGSLTADPPNILMIIADDQAWTDYGFMGHPHIETPHLDQLAKESLIFPRGYVPSSLCRPSLASIVTGLFPQQHRITSNDPPIPDGVPARRARQHPNYKADLAKMIANIERVPTLPRLLATKGYLSLQTGKWWEGHHCRCGFTDGMTHGDPKRGGRHGDEGLTIGRQGLKEITTFINRAVEDKKPFYVWYAPFMPHSPHTPPARLLAKYRDKTPSIHIARYWAMCEWFDETCGALLQHLDRKGLADNTIVVYVCDNGWIQNPNSGRYAPRSKRSPYDGGLRTPIMLRWPHKLKPRSSNAAVSSVDLMPTLLHAVGIQPTEAMQGINLLNEQAIQDRKAIFGAVFKHNAVDVNEPASSLNYRWVIADGWKLIVPARWNLPQAAVELYHIHADPIEQHNLAAKHPQRVQTLQQHLDQWWSPTWGDE